MTKPCIDDHLRYPLPYPLPGFFPTTLPEPYPKSKNPTRPSLPPGRGNGQRGPFFRPSKTAFKRVLQNQILIENDDENDDDNGDNFDV